MGNIFESKLSGSMNIGSIAALKLKAGYVLIVDKDSNVLDVSKFPGQLLVQDDGSIVVSEYNGGMDLEYASEIKAGVIKVGDGLHINAKTGVLSVYNVLKLVSDKGQCIQGEVEFKKLPTSTVVPTKDSEFVTKGYVSGVRYLYRLVEEVKGTFKLQRKLESETEWIDASEVILSIVNGTAYSSENPLITLSHLNEELDKKQNNITPSECLSFSQLGDILKLVLNIDNSDKVLSQSDSGLLVNLNLTYDADNHLIRLIGKDQVTIASIDSKSLEVDSSKVDVNNSSLDLLIPGAASAENKLADKRYVEDLVQTNSANFRGNWSTWSNVPSVSSLYPEDYAGSRVPTTNDYLVVSDASGYGDKSYEGTWRFKYSGLWDEVGKNGWLPEYRVNETPFDQTQLDAINSGINTIKRIKYDNYEVELTALNNKFNFYLPLTGGTITGDLQVAKSIIVGSHSSNGLSNCIISGYNISVRGSNHLASGKNNEINGGDYCVISGVNNKITNGVSGAHAEGNTTEVSANNGHSEGFKTIVTGPNAHAEGRITKAAGNGSHASGAHALANHSFAFCWSGVAGSQDDLSKIQDSDYYQSHGIGTFNINPVGGLSGIYVGELPITTQFSDIYIQLVNTKRVQFKNNGSITGDTGYLEFYNHLNVATIFTADRNNKLTFARNGTRAEFQSGTYIDLLEGSTLKLNNWDQIQLSNGTQNLTQYIKSQVNIIANKIIEATNDLGEAFIKLGTEDVDVENADGTYTTKNVDIYNLPNAVVVSNVVKLTNALKEINTYLKELVSNLN